MSKSGAVPSGVTSATLAKDLRLEWRSKDALNSMLFFSLLVVVVFSFSFDPNAEESRQIAGGEWLGRGPQRGLEVGAIRAVADALLFVLTVAFFGRQGMRHDLSSKAIR